MSDDRNSRLGQKESASLSNPSSNESPKKTGPKPKDPAFHELCLKHVNTAKYLSERQYKDLATKHPELQDKSRLQFRKACFNLLRYASDKKEQQKKRDSKAD